MYAAKVAEMPQRVSAGFVEGFGKESGSMTKTVGILAWYCCNTRTISSMYWALYSATPAAQSQGAL